MAVHPTRGSCNLKDRSSGAEQRDLGDAAPALVEEHTRSGGSDVASGDRWQLAVAVEGLSAPVAPGQSASSRKPLTSAANWLLCWKRKPWAESG
jgi:hypothetical protein